MLTDLSIIILAAGKGTRMQSNLPKVMHKIAGREMLNMVIDEAKKLNPHNITIVVSNEMMAFYDYIKQSHNDISLNFVLQNQQMGTGHAVNCALESFKNSSNKLAKKTLILYGDTPLINHQTLTKMLDKIDQFALCILSFENFEKNNYGKLIINDHQILEKIIEHKDANLEQQKISICNSGVIAIESTILQSSISKIQNNNASHEYYLTDLVAIINQSELQCTHINTHNSEVLGVNSRIELANIEKIYQKQIRKKMLENGVTLISPKTVFFSYDTKIKNDVIIHPHVIFGKNVEIASGVEIKSFSHIEGATIDSNCVIGPFARIRKETEIAKDCHIGNFVEIKKSKIGAKTKINHLSYIGDSDVGKSVNIGAGTITCNYDGINKHQTKIGDNVFIGSNTALIAPIEIESEALIGAGSVITKKVNYADLAIARSQQHNIKNGATKYKKPK